MLEIPSRRFGSYRLTEKVGEGGMAEVFRAQVVDPLGTLRTVALKLEKRNLPRSTVATEAKLLELLRHENLVARYEAGEVGGRCFVAMEDVYGGDVAALLGAHRSIGHAPPLRIALRIAVELLKGLAHVHTARAPGGHRLGLVHGDVSTRNVLLSAAGDVKLADFGVAISGDPERSALPRGVHAGTLHALAPEQVAGERASVKSDLFSVGVILFELLTLARPFDGISDADVLAEIRACRPVFPEELDEDLRAILATCLAKSPKERPSSAGSLCGELVRLQLDRDLQCTRGDLAEHVQVMLGIVG